ncbi:hypothetical protein I4U23_022394 [Adineta vaga]|nr:hypothetical protein I4U23_022394 [Adineta vaga]
MTYSEKFSFLSLFILIVQIIAEDMRSFRMSTMKGWQFQCVNTTCLPYATLTVPTILKCQTACLSQIQCKAASFYQLTLTCKLFNDIWNQNENMLADFYTISMIVIFGTRIPPEPTTTSTTSTSSSSSTTSTSSTTTTTATTSTSSTSSTTTTTTTTSTSTSSTKTTTTSTTTTGSSYTRFALSQTIDGRVVTCSAVDNTYSAYTECSNLRQGGLYFPAGYCPGTWISTTSSYWDTLGFCRKLSNSPTGSISVYYDCDTSQTRVVWNASTWSTFTDNGYTHHLRCFF